MIEVKFCDGNISPFRSVCWAVLRNGKVVSYCFSEEVAHSLRLILTLEGAGGQKG